MNKNIHSKFVWVPRILSILFVVFLLLFSLDVFEQELSLWQSLLAFGIHNIPAMVLIVILIFAWRYELVGAIGYLLVSLFYVIMVIDDFEVTAFIVLAGPLLLLSILFTIGWILQRKKSH